MKVEVEFTLGFQETHKKIDENISRNLYQIRRQIKQYKTGERILSDDFYKMEEENPLFGKCAEFAIQRKLVWKYMGIRLNMRKKMLRVQLHLFPILAITGARSMMIFQLNMKNVGIAMHI